MKNAFFLLLKEENENNKGFCPNITLFSVISNSLYYI